MVRRSASYDDPRITVRDDGPRVSPVPLRRLGEAIDDRSDGLEAGRMRNEFALFKIRRMPSLRAYSEWPRMNYCGVCDDYCGAARVRM